MNPILNFLKQSHYTVNVPNGNTFGFQIGGHHSVWILVWTVVMSEIRTNLFGFQTEISVRNPNRNRSNVRISDISTRLDRFIYKNILFMTIFIVKRSRLTFERPEMNRTFEIRTSINRTNICSDFSVVWKPNVRFSDVDCIFLFNLLSYVAK